MILRREGNRPGQIRADVHQRHIRGPVPNVYFAQVSFSSGALGTVHYNLVRGRRIFRAEFLSLNEGQIGLDDGAPERQGPADYGAAAVPVGTTLAPQHWLGFWHESRHFIDRVARGRSPLTHFGDAAKTMELVERILAAARQG